MEDSELSNPPHRPETNRSQGDRIGALEQDMHTVKHRLNRFEKNHDDLPVRVNRLELIAQNQSDLLKDLTRNVQTMGTKVMYGLGAAGAVIAVAQLAVPLLIKAMIQ